MPQKQRQMVGSRCKREEREIMQHNPSLQRCKRLQKWWPGRGRGRLSEKTLKEKPKRGPCQQENPRRRRAA
jgi:hypothetical protein